MTLRVRTVPEPVPGPASGGLLQREVAIWMAAFAVLVLFVWLFSSILLPFVAGLVLAYFLDPVADRLEKMGMSRLWATLVILAVFILLFVVALLIVVPLLAGNLTEFLDKAPDYARKLQQLIIDKGGPVLKSLGPRFSVPDLQGQVGGIIAKGATWLGDLLASIWSGGQALVGILSLIVVTPVVAFYLLVDWDRMLAKMDAWTPPRHRATVRQLATEVNGAIGGFIRGQALVCLLLGTWYAVGLTLAGLNFGFLIGMIAGFLTFIPYVGSLTGLVLAAGVAVVQFWPDWLWIGLVLAVFFSGQFLEGNILSPKLVGEAVGLHPVWLMFALFAFGSLFGFVGLLIAVPVAATIGVLARFALRRYLASPLYRGEAPQLEP
jgi:predicted PurR-regulated permease PerM